MSNDHVMLQTLPRSAPSGLASPWRTRLPLIALAVAASVVAVALVADPLTAVAFVPAGVAASYDAATGRLPDRWVVATAVLATIAAVAHGSIGSAAVAALLVGAAVLVFHLTSPSALGFGDVKLAAALAPALVAGTGEPALSGVGSIAATWLCCASALAIGYGALARRTTVPFGPALVVGAVVALVLAPGGFVR